MSTPSVAHLHVHSEYSLLDGAANIDAPAVINQTSFPSHHGPIVLITTRRSVSVLPITMCSIPTPKSNPSSTKNPIQRTVMMMNQMV